MVVVCLLSLVLLIAAIGAYIGNLKRLGVRTKSLDWLVNTATLATFASVFLGAGAGAGAAIVYAVPVESSIVISFVVMFVAWVPCFMIGLVPTKIYQLATARRVRILGCGKHGGNGNVLAEEITLLTSDECAKTDTSCQPSTIRASVNAEMETLPER
jgi:hypothetical protein